MPVPRKIITPERLFLVLLFGLAAFLHSSHHLNSDEGVVLAAAWDMLNGKVLYLDFFEFITPLSFYFFFFVAKLFGPHYFAAKAAAIVVLFFSALGLYRIGGRLYRMEYAIFPPVILLLGSAYWPLIHYHTLALFFIVWSVYFLLRFLENSQNRFAVIGGLAAAGAILSVQSRGGFFFVALSLFWLYRLYQGRSNWRPALLFWLASLLPLAWLLRWPLEIIKYNLIVFPLTRYTDIAFVRPYSLIFFFIISLLLGLVLRKRLNRESALLYYLLLFFLISSYALADSFHLALALWPFYLLLPLALDYSKDKSLNSRRLFYIVSGACLFAVLWPSFNHLLYFPLFSARPGIVSEIENDCPGSALYAGPFLPGLYFETKKHNPTAFGYLLAGSNPAEHFHQAAQSLRSNPPECAILNYSLVEKYDYSRDNPVDLFIRDNYKLENTKGNFLIYKMD